MRTQPEPAQRWTPGQAWRYGVLLFALEAAQSVLLLPLLLHWISTPDIALWASLTAGLGLVNAAAATYSLPLVRSIASQGVDAPLPHNQRAVLLRADRIGAAILAGAQACLVAWLVGVGLVAGAADWAALSLYVLAMQMRLAALNRFVWINGRLQLGRDKRLLVQGSALVLLLALPLAALTGSVVGLSMAAVAGSAWLLRQASRACGSLGHNSFGNAVAWPTRREATSLLLLNLAGFLNLGTDVLVANHHLPPAQAVSYAFWSRALMSLVLLVGLYAQIRFPFWPRLQATDLRRELVRALLALAVLPPLVVLVYAAAASIPHLAPLCVLPAWMPALMACTTVLACGCLLAGQMSTACGAYGFLVPSAVLAATAPLAAGAAAHWAGDQTFVAGYLLVNAGLCALNVGCLWLCTRGTTAAPGTQR